MVEWKFSKRQPACAVCARPFEEGEAHVSALLVQSEQVAREEACLACWKQRDGREALFWWRTRHSLQKRTGLALDLEALEALFVRLEDRKEIALLELRYVIALILMRKRRIKIERIERDGERERLVVSRPRREGLYSVEVFDFDGPKIEELRRRLQEVLEGAEGEAPPVAESASPAPASGDAN